MASAEQLADSDYLAIATEELQSYVWPFLVGMREEYGVADYDVSVVSGTAAYRLPPRASGDALRDVQLLSGTTYVPLTRITPEERNQFAATGAVSAYLFQDNDIVLVPEPTAATTLRLKYHKRPSKLVATTAVATISSINGARLVITTTTTIPSTITASSISVDVVDNTPGFKTLAMDYTTAATTSGTTITLTTALPASVSAGDYVCLAGESPVAQIPVEAHPLLAQRAATVCQNALGDAKWQASDALCERMRKEYMALSTPRSKGSRRPLVNRNGPGWGNR